MKTHGHPAPSTPESPLKTPQKWCPREMACGRGVWLNTRYICHTIPSTILERDFNLESSGDTQMYSGFNLKTNIDFSEYEDEGKNLFARHRRQIRDKLDAFMLNDGHLDGSEMQENWFPQLNCDVFISHSHKDEKRAVGLAGWLNHAFDLTTFIDSSVWGYADDLLRRLDDEFCQIEGRSTYSYELRNYSTSHVHMMLSTALTMMIDKSECVIFLNSPNSISSSDVIGNQTRSPWIYHEIAMTQLIRRRSLSEYRPDLLKKSEKTIIMDSAQGVPVKYRLDMQHLNEITDNHLISWFRMQHVNPTDYPLDHLYQQAGIANVRLES
ncbi:hypothetical protein JZ785_18280 [Alicyclobacillus curvatus]|nr:hypothetical protein JZ785_18280 [Alicyclobacillus curvatus]